MNYFDWYILTEVVGASAQTLCCRDKRHENVRCVARKFFRTTATHLANQYNFTLLDNIHCLSTQVYFCF